MNQIAESVVSEIDRSELESVAQQVVGDLSARLEGEPSWTEIDESHGDLRTLAITRVSGTASTANGKALWSCVLKIVDTTVDGGPGNRGDWIDPMREEAVYRLGLFADDDLPFRSVISYRVSEPRPGLKILWLEDLSEAEKPPFSIDQLHQILRNLGEFNGCHSGRKFEHPITLGEDSYLSRWTGRDFGPQIDRVRNLVDRDEIKRVFRSTTIDEAWELYSALDQLCRECVKLPHGVSFGDSNAGNLFLLRSQTVAVDWASLTVDPIGVDAGCLIGSSLARGQDGTDVLEAETELFSSYLDGLRSGGWSGDETDVRRAFFGQYGQYLMASGIWPDMLEDAAFAEQWRGWAEKRFEMSFDDLPDLLAVFVDSYGDYLAEVRGLLR